MAPPRPIWSDIEDLLADIYSCAATVALRDRVIDREERKLLDTALSTIHLFRRANRARLEAVYQLTSGLRPSVWHERRRREDEEQAVRERRDLERLLSRRAS